MVQTHASRTPVRGTRLAERLGFLVARGFARATWPIVLRTSLKREHRGFRILSFLPDDEGLNELLASRVALALDLIAACDPRRFARIRRDMPNVHIIREGGGIFDATTHTCVVDWPSVMWHPVAYLAETIVHEATHARLHAMGIGYPEEWRRRVERRCLLEEIAFLRRLPDDGALAAEREAAVEGKLAREWWAPHKAIDRTIRRARAERMPGWLVRWLERRKARLAREAAARAAEESGTPAP